MAGRARRAQLRERDVWRQDDPLPYWTALRVISVQLARRRAERRMGVRITGPIRFRLSFR
jgi:hypothetical protein